MVPLAKHSYYLYVLKFSEIDISDAVLDPSMLPPLYTPTMDLPVSYNLVKST